LRHRRTPVRTPWHVSCQGSRPVASDRKSQPLPTLGLAAQITSRAPNGREHPVSLARQPRYDVVTSRAIARREWHVRCEGFSPQTERACRSRGEVMWEDWIAGSLALGAMLGGLLVGDAVAAAAPSQNQPRDERHLPGVPCAQPGNPSAHRLLGRRLPGRPGRNCDPYGRLQRAR